MKNKLIDYLQNAITKKRKICLRKIILQGSFFVIFFNAPCFSHAQSFFGIGFGSENMHISANQLRSFVPNLSYQFITGNMQQAYYIEVTGLKRRSVNETGFVTEQGDFAPIEEVYQYTHVIFQGGWKIFINGDADERKLLFEAGGGLTGCISFNNYSVKRFSSQYSSSENKKTRTNTWGLGSMCGARYFLKPVIIELKTNLDFLLKRITEYEGQSNVHTNIRLSLMIPLKHY